ncbi:MAG: hypothetical protein FD122_3744 [Stygiobacter sp.]|nr:MAG: hypothetical protein FD122_3744 [Stygiobacter sp.]
MNSLVLKILIQIWRSEYKKEWNYKQQEYFSLMKFSVPDMFCTSQVLLISFILQNSFNFLTKIIDLLTIFFKKLFHLDFALFFNLINPLKFNLYESFLNFLLSANYFSSQ